MTASRPLAAVVPIVASLVLALAPGAGRAETPTASARVNAVTVTTQADSVVISVKISGSAKYRAELIDSPDRLVIDLEDTAYAWRKTPLEVGKAPLKQIRGSQFTKSLTRLVVELTRPAGYAIREDSDGLAIIVPTTVEAARPEPDRPVESRLATQPPADTEPKATSSSATSARAGHSPQRPTAAPAASSSSMATTAAPKPAAVSPAEPKPASTATAALVAEPPGTPAARKARSTAALEELKAPPVPTVVAAAPVAPPTPPVAVIDVPRPASREPVRLAQAPPPPPPAPTNGRLISLDFKDADVVNLLRILAAESGKNIVIGEDVKGKISISLRNVPWELALDTILEARGLQKVEKDNVIRIVSVEQLAKEREARARVEEAKLKSETDIRTKVAEAQLKEQEVQQRKLAADAAAAEAQARGPLKEETIRLSYADPEEIAKTLQGILGIPPEGVQASTTPISAPGSVPGYTGPPNPALGQVVPPLIPSSPPTTPTPPPGPVMSPSAEVLAKGITIRAHKPTNSIFIRHYEADLERIKKLIREKLDIPLPQVKIEARMEILDRGDLFALGIQWGGGGVFATTQKGTIVGRGFTRNQTPGTSLNNILTGTDSDKASSGIRPQGLADIPLGSPPAFQNPNRNLTLTTAIPVSATTGLPTGGNVINLPIGALLSGAATAGTGGLAFGIVGSRLNLNLALEALRTLGKTTTLARPEVVTVENNKAVIQLGEEIPYATVSSAGTQIQFKEALLKLEVTPTVIREGDVYKIKMKVVVENNSRSTTATVDLGSAGSPPVINRRKAETEVLVREGERLVIGGVSTSINSEETRKFPLLGDLPILGWLFKHEGQQETRRELILFLTPSILKTTTAQVPQAPVPRPEPPKMK